MGAELQGGTFAGAQLQGANLHGADLRAADLSCYEDHGQWGSQISCANLEGANLRHSDLRFAKIDATSLRSGSWKLADLRDIDIGPTGDVVTLMDELAEMIPDDFNMRRMRLGPQPDTPKFPDTWEHPDVMFNPSDAIKQSFSWGDPKWGDS